MARKCTDKNVLERESLELSLLPVGMYEHPDSITVQRITESLLLWGLVLSLELLEISVSSYFGHPSERTDMSFPLVVAEALGAASMPTSTQPLLQYGPAC